MLARLRARLRGTPRNVNPEVEAIEKKQRRRKAMIEVAYRSLPTLRILLFIVGYTWMICLPSPRLGRGIYIDENALAPGQVNTYWSWADVHTADRYLEDLEQLRDRNASSNEKALFIRTEFMKLGLPAATQNYSFKIGATQLEGVNTYAVFSSPRTSGTEAVVVAASWVSLNTDTNLRGIAIVLSLAAYLKKYSLWSKDIIFIISGGHLEGIRAWLDAYHGLGQSNLETTPLTLHSGVIWTALAIDYPGHSFSHLGVFFEGLNGRLPNQDLMNSLNVISTHTGGVPVLLYDHLEDEVYSKLPTWVWMPQWFRKRGSVKSYFMRARNIIRHVRYQMSGRASGIHGLFHQYRIDAITLFAVPAVGPHGFHSLGRVVESTLRTMNNLLERLHASFFFYILTGPGTFLKIGQYLPSAVIISVAMMFGGLEIWLDAGWVAKPQFSPEKSTSSNVEPIKAKSTTWETRRRKVLLPLAIMLGTHVVGGLLFWVVTSSWFINRPGGTTSYLPIIPVSLIVFSILSALLTPDTQKLRNPSEPAPLWSLLKAFNLCLSSTVISIISVLNFSLAATIAILLGIPLSISSPTPTLVHKMVKTMSYYVLLAPVWLMLLTRPISQSMWDWQVLGVWFAPFVCMVYLPLVLQAMVVCMLSP